MDNAGAEKITEEKGKEKIADSDAPSAGASGVKKYNEDLVTFILGAIGFTNVAGIQDVLVLVNGDTSAAIDLILEEISPNKESSKGE
ncbi:hypothetical protein KI387_006425, partial [Taxus chinensis]